MRRITLWLFSTVAAVVLLFSYRTSTNSPATPAAAEAPLPEPAAAGSTPPSSAAAGSGSGKASAGPKEYDGSSVQTQWGPLQVRITVADGKITDIAAPTSPADNPADAGVTAGALPQLREQVLAAQSASIDGVSGATFTSEAYKQSLQAALDAAKI
ncbi:FMN-binding protein [Paractinoplanes deccanensis]|uniref:FMN-binding protein n=1 Tax=Paractinoplanes deccanensis TaxID=113561 RepID=A0ABQ3Y3Y7_9ACTN|nr:FMN-binding protein [Actinoplanes deccanensis]GID74688.1 FMN-binding protein [Actinoplanes deccanensis]